MDSSQLQQLAERTRSAREAGMALMLGTGILALFLFVPLAVGIVPQQASAPEPVAPESRAFSAVPLEATAAIVYDLATKEVLFEKNADAQLPLASLTKMLTVYAAVHTLPLDTLITISSEATRLAAPRTFMAGQVFALRDLARLTLTASLNDGAAAIMEATAARENRTQTAALAGAAAALSLSQTYAVNGSGLDETAAVSGGYGSARDLAILAGALVSVAPDITAATTEAFAEAKSQGGTAFKVANTDPIVDSVPHILLSKTGYTGLAGGNLALVIDVGIGHPVAIVVLGSSRDARFTDGSALINATLAHFAGVDSL